MWKALAEIYGLGTQTFNQSEFAARCTKPTTAGGNPEDPFSNAWSKKRTPRETEGKTKEQLCQESQALSRWPPLLMCEIATALQLGTLKDQVKMRALSWKEHVAAGHTPFRKDCLMCQQASAKGSASPTLQRSTSCWCPQPGHEWSVPSCP